MSRIDDLIKEKCPNGVDFINVCELFNIKNGYTPSKNNDNYKNNIYACSLLFSFYDFIISFSLQKL